MDRSGLLRYIPPQISAKDPKKTIKASFTTVSSDFFGGESGGDCDVALFIGEDDQRPTTIGQPGLPRGRLLPARRRPRDEPLPRHDRRLRPGRGSARLACCDRSLECRRLCSGAPCLAPPST